MSTLKTNKIENLTTADGGISINNSGNVGIANASPATPLDVNGSVTISDKIIHSGDTNTAIRFPAADTFAIETAGVERIRVTSTGAVAIEGASNYGTSGQVLTSNGNDAPTWQGVAGGISMAQQFRLTSDTQGNVLPLTNWEAIDTVGQGNIGSAMDISSGVFTYPSTGIYFVLFNLVGYSDNHSQNIIAQIEHTLDNSNYSVAATGRQGIYDFNNSYPSWATASCMYIFDITDTSNQKTKFNFSAGQGNEYVHGDTSNSATNVTFIRLGDT